MTYEEKLKIILSAIREAQKVAIKGKAVKLYPSKENLLSDINPQELHDFLLKLQEDEKVIIVRDIPTQLKDISEREILENKTYFYIEILDKYDSWQSDLLIKEKAKLENLSETNFNNISHIMHLIDEQLELDQSEKLAIDFVSSAREIEGYEPEDVNDIINTYTRNLTYLKNIGVVKNFTTAYMTLSSELTLDIARFFEVLEQITNVGQRRKNIKKEKKEEKSPDKAPDKTTVLYEITYTKQRQVLMNNAQISKPDFNSENDLVFSFLYEHPNKRVTREELEKAVGGKLTKSLHKIVENLGFEGDTKEVFFSVSKNAIEFRNPITKKDLEEMKKPLIKLVKGGGKLVIPH